MAEVKTRYGVLTVPDIKTDTIGRFLQYYGEWAWDEASFVASVIPANARVLDIGAFIGTFGLGLSKLQPLRALCMVEANTALIPYLQTNVERNSSVPTTVLNAVVTGLNGKPLTGRADANNLGSSSFADGASGDIRVEVPNACMTLEQIRLENGPFDLVKIDAEGLDLDILQSDSEFLAKGETTIWVECNENAISLKIADLLLSWGLDLYYFAFPSHNPDNFRGNAKPIFPLSFEAGLLASPKTRPVAIDALQDHGCILQPVWSGEDLRQAMWTTPPWGMAEWHDRPLPHVVALAGHTLRGEDYSDFLSTDWAPGEMLWHRVDRLQTTLEAERRIFEKEHRQHQAKLAATKLEIAEASNELKRSLTEDLGKIRAERDGLQAIVLNSRDENDRLEARISFLQDELLRTDAQLRELSVTPRAFEVALAESATLSLDRLSELGKVKSERDQLRTRVLQLEHISPHASSQSIEKAPVVRVWLRNVVWRVARQVRRGLAGVPFLRKLVRFGFRIRARINSRNRNDAGF